MWQSIWAFVLVPAIVAAQSPSVGGVPDTALPEQVTTQPKTPIYRAYTYYTQIRQGSNEQAAVALDAGGSVISSGPVPAGLTALNLELQNSPDIAVEKLRYPKSKRLAFPFTSDLIPVNFGDAVRFRIRASRNATLGLHTLNGKLVFQMVSKAGISESQTIDVQIPINVVDRHTKQQQGNWPYGSEMKKSQLIALIVLSPVLIAVAIPFLAACVIAGVAKHPFCAD